MKRLIGWQGRVGLVVGALFVLGWGEIQVKSWELSAPSSFSIWNPGGDCNLALTVAHDSDEVEDFFVTFSVPAGGVGARRLLSGGNEVAYQLFASPGSSVPLGELPNVGLNEVLTGQLQAGEGSQSLSFCFELEGSSWLPPGTYTDSFVIRLFQGTVEAGTEVASQSVSLDWVVGQETHLSFHSVGGALSGDIDFGSIWGEVTRGIDCWVLSNVDYQLSVASENEGAMINQRGTRLTYSLAVDGAGVVLNTSEETPLPGVSSMTTQQGRQHAFSVTLHPDANQEAGSYSDTIRISIWAP